MSRLPFMTLECGSRTPKARGMFTIYSTFSRSVSEKPEKIAETADHKTRKNEKEKKRDQPRMNANRGIVPAADIGVDSRSFAAGLSGAPRHY
jgi:hypothetical protein